MKNLRSILAICTLSILIISCAKDGETGPQGVQGPAGPQGNANVKAYELNVDFSSSALSSYYERYKDVYWSEITSNVYNYGLVMVYSYYSNSWRALPCEYSISSSNSWMLRYDVHVGYVRLWRQYSNGAIPASGLYGYKIVCIPAASRSAHPDIDYNNYKEVKEAFNLQD